MYIVYYMLLINSQPMNWQLCDYVIITPELVCIAALVEGNRHLHLNISIL